MRVVRSGGRPRRPATPRRRAAIRLGAGEPQPRRRDEPNRALARRVGEADRLLETVAAGGPARRPQPAHLEGPRERREPDAVVADAERRLPGLARAEGAIVKSNPASPP